MFFIDEKPDLKMFKKPFYLPINDQNKKKGSAVFLLGTNYNSTVRLLNHELIKPRYYRSYYIEKGLTYFITKESGIETYYGDQLIHENLFNTKDNGEEKIIYIGSDSDIRNIESYLNFHMIDYLNKDYCASIKYPLEVHVYKTSKVPDNSKSIININSESIYSKNIYKNYKIYIKYNIMEIILMNINENMNESLKEAILLYETGLYDIYKKHWIFDNKLLSLCRSIEKFINKKGHLNFVQSIVVKDNINKLIKTFMDVIKDDISSLLENTTSILEDNSKGYFEKYDTSNPILNDGSIKLNESTILAINESENSQYSTQLKRILYRDRIKSNREINIMYDKVKEDFNWINKTFYNLDMYKGDNLFIDLSYYNEVFLKNNTYKLQKGINVFFEFLDDLINDTRLDKYYNKKTVIIPISDWDFDKSIKMWTNKTINPVSVFYYFMINNMEKLKSTFKDTIFIFINDKAYFKMSFNNFDKSNIKLFTNNINRLRNPNDIVEEDPTEPKDSQKVITADIIDKVEDTQKVTINNIVPTDDNKKETAISKEDKDKAKKDKNKNELVDKINKAASISTDVEDTLDAMDDDDRIKEIIANLSAEPDNGPKINNARASRMLKLNNDLLNKNLKGRSIKDMLSENIEDESAPLPETSLNIDSVNPEWNNLKYMNAFDSYDIDKDIMGIFNSFSYMTYPLVIKDIKAEDTSTSEDCIETYTVQYEDLFGKRFTIKLDVPLFVDNRYMKLRGNRKNIPWQLFPIPIMKIEEEAVQIASNYNKIFIRKFGTTTGKSNIHCDKLIKVLNKNTFDGLAITTGDNRKICSKYECPIDYMDLASIYTKFETEKNIIMFNQDEIYNNYKVDESKGFPYGISKSNKEVLYYENTGEDFNVTFSFQLMLLLLNDLGKDFNDKYKKATKSVRYTYSKASILSTEIPVILICCYAEGLQKVLKKANIEYKIIDKKEKIDWDMYDMISFKDAHLVYKLSYSSSLLMNGLKTCDTMNYSIGDINNKNMYLDFLDSFGGRIKADGLDNFYDLMIDKPITYNTLVHYKLPTDYVSVLLYANDLLADNKYIAHTNITGRRIRRQEQIAGMIYHALAKAYGQYATNIRHGRNQPMTIKQTAVIDEVLTNNTTDDGSIINALHECEDLNTVTPKGPSGLNNDRSYSLDKRTYDDSMLNVFGMSTGFAGNVGIARQATIDMNIDGTRGYIVSNDQDKSKLNTTKAFCMTEALTPFGTTRDDPFRTAMTFVQTSKHGMRCKRSNPLLITSGADEAMPYMISNTFAFKAKHDGKVVEKTDEYMIVEYKDNTYDYIDLNDHVEKNSSSGFFVTLKLDSDIKVGQKIKKNQILAYDKYSFSDEVGIEDNISYDIGCLAKFAILNTDEGYEDSAIISEDLADNMTSDIVLKKDVNLPKDTNVYNIVEKGQHIEEGDTLMIMQTPQDSEDANLLLKNLIGDDQEITNLGRVPITSKVTGIVQDIAIYRTVELDELSDSLRKLCKKYEKKITDRKKLLKKYNISTTGKIYGSDSKLDNTGKVKNIGEGVLIEFYLKYEDKMSVGDKLIYYSALKGVIKDIFPEGKEPYSEYRPNEKIHSLLAAGSINGRMVTSILVNAGINKVLIELSRQCKDILGIKYDPNLK